MSLRPTEGHHQEQQLLAAEAVRQAVERCQIDRVIDLLKGGAPSVLDAEGQTPLHLAAAAGHLSLVEALLQAGCDVSVQDFVSIF
jgi:ankyrin repeat protein